MSLGTKIHLLVNDHNESQDLVRMATHSKLGQWYGTIYHKDTESHFEIQNQDVFRLDEETKQSLLLSLGEPLIPPGGVSVSESQPEGFAIPPRQEIDSDEAGLPVSPVNGNDPPITFGPFPTRFTNCYNGDQGLWLTKVGFAFDYGAYQKLGSNVTNVQLYVASLILNMNYAYSNQLGLELQLQALLIQTTPQPLTPPSANWNYLNGNCPSSINGALDAFTNWKMALPANSDQQVAMFQLMTACWTSGVVGLAWIGTMCNQRYSTSVMSLIPGNVWLAAHEMGHNIGAPHPFQNASQQGKFGGIMDYGDGKYQGLYQFNPVTDKPYLCQGISKAMTCTNGCIQPLTRCFESLKPECGNGVVEPNAGEQCDDGRANNGIDESCCTKTCKWKKGTLCNSFSGSASSSSLECCNNCIPRLTRRSCGANGKGYCAVNATCATSNTCTYYGFQLCGMDPNNACMMQCLVNGQCNSMAGWKDSKTGLPLDMRVRDGSICVRVPLAQCQNGKCVQ